MPPIKFLHSDYLATVRVEFSLSGNLAELVADIQNFSFEKVVFDKVEDYMFGR